MTTLTDSKQILAELTTNFLDDYFQFYPTTASGLGLHEYDGRISDLSPGSIQAHVQCMQNYKQRLLEIDPETLPQLVRFDYDLLCWQVGVELWQWTIEREYQQNPMVYAYDAMIDIYIKRNYAPLAERTRHLTVHLNEIPQAMQVARENLHPSLPRILIEEALDVYNGLISFLEHNLEEPMQSLQDDALAQQLWEARDSAASALADFYNYLQTTLLPASHDNFAIGAERFANMLRYNELIDIPLDRLLHIGEEDLAQNQEAIRQLAYRIDPDSTIQEQMIVLGRKHPDADDLIQTTLNILGDLRTFLIERDLITLPDDTDCRVEPTPSFARWAFAMMETAGPFETVSTESFYYVTLPEPDWTHEQVEGWLTKFDYATLTDVSIHEAYPGHFVHFARVRNAPTRLAKVFAAYTHYESWAHYVEQMMLEQGYDEQNDDLRLAQLAESLVRNCRYICAIKMHTQGMTIDEATRFFEENAYMDTITASKEARRGTYDPGYINYTLGKLLLLKLLDEYKAAHGATFSLKRFHDEYIGYGSPPIPILRKLLLPHDNGTIL